MTPDLRVSRPPRVARVAVGTGHLLYHQAVLQLLMGPAALVWDHIDDVVSAAHVAERVADLVVGDNEQVRREVVAFLDQLARAGLVDVLRPPRETGYVRPEAVGFTSDESTCLLVDLRDGRRQMLNDEGSQVWTLVCQLHYASRVVEALQARFTDAPLTLAADVHQLLEELVTQGFLRKWSSP